MNASRLQKGELVQAKIAELTRKLQRVREALDSTSIQPSRSIVSKARIASELVNEAVGVMEALVDGHCPPASMASEWLRKLNSTEPMQGDRVRYMGALEHLSGEEGVALRRRHHGPALEVLVRFIADDGEAWEESWHKESEIVCIR